MKPYQYLSTDAEAEMESDFQILSDEFPVLGRMEPSLAVNVGVLPPLPPGGLVSQPLLLPGACDQGHLEHHQHSGVLGQRSALT